MKKVKREKGTMEPVQPRALDLAQRELENIHNHDPDNFPIDPPPSKLLQGNAGVIDLSAHLRPPNLDETEALARDGQGALKRLTDEQLQQIRTTGSFTVPSQRFPGQTHEWKIHTVLQKGKHATTETFKDGLVFSASQFVVFIPNRLWRGDTFSMWQGLKSIVVALVGIPVQLIGWIEKDTRKPSMARIEDIREDTILQALLGMSKKEFGDAAMVEITTKDDVSIRFHTAKLEPIRSKLTIPYTTFEKAWNDDQLARRQRLRETFADVNADVNELNQEIINQEAKDFQDAIFHLIHSTLEPDDAKELCDLMNAIGMIRETIQSYNATKQNASLIYANELRAKHSVLGRIPDWVSRKQMVYEEQWTKAHPFTNVLANLSQKLPGQEGYLFQKNLNLADAVQDQVDHETVKVPRKTFEWSFRIWSPKNWKVTENLGFYTVDKYRHFETSSSKIGWRLANTLIRAGSYFWNGLFGTLANMIYGPFGLRSWVGLDEFQPDRTVDSRTGLVTPSGSKWNTWFGRIRALWRNISDSRKQFEATPEGGFFGKSFTRPFNVIWNYFFKGVIGTLGAFLGHALLGVGNFVISTALVVSSPVWALGGAFGLYLVSQLIYDPDSTGTAPEWFPLFQILIKDLLVKGVGQLLLSPIVAVGSAVVAGCAMVGHGLRFTLRSFWDFVMYHLLIKWKGRVPERNGFIAKRVKGPGLSMQYYQIIDSDFALLMLQHELENMSIDVYRKRVKEVIDVPSNELRRFHAQFRPVGLRSDDQSVVSKQFEQVNQACSKKLDEVIANHRSQFVVRGYAQMNWVRMTRDDVNRTLTLGEVLCKEIYEDLISSVMQGDAERNDFWQLRHLQVNDFQGLTRKILCKTISEGILQPIEEVDPAGFRLHLNTVSVREYVSQFFRDPSCLDTIDVVTHIQKAAILPSAEDNYPPSQIQVVTPRNLNSIFKPEEKYVVLRKLE